MVAAISLNQGSSDDCKTVVMVVHDLSSACRYADHLVAMKAGQIVAELSLIHI